MPPGNMPSTLPAWAKWLLQKSPWISVGLQEVIDYIGELGVGTDTAVGQWRRVHCVFTHTGTTDNADKFITTFDVANWTGGVLDSSWTTQDYTDVDGLLSNFVASWLTKAPPTLVASERRYYRMSFHDLPPAGTKPSEDKFKFQPSGPPERIFTDTRIGSQGGIAQAPQLAMTTTEKTPYPRHWGRNYLPMPAPGILDANGRFATTHIDGMATALATLYGGWMAKNFQPVVPVTSIENTPARALLGVTQIQIDDVPDVIRRRRWHRAVYRKVL